MLPITFLSHLPLELQPVITYFLKDCLRSVDENMAVIRQLCPDVAPKCEVHITCSKSMTELELDASDEELIRTIIETMEISLRFKLLCIDKVFQQRGMETPTDFRTQILRFLNECMPADAPPLPVMPKPQRTPLHPDIPIEESFSILDKIDISHRTSVKNILSDHTLQIPLKFVALREIVKPEELSLLKRYLKEKDDEEKFLSQFSEEVRGEVAAVLREDSLTFQVKMDLLKHILPNFKDRNQCREYLKAQKQAEKQQKEAIRFLNSFEEDEEKINVLILGETGVGKSTFVNGLANYLMFANLHEAKASGPEILISTKFTQWSKGREYTLSYPASGGDNRNENLNAGQSATQDPKFYKFYGENLQGKYREINVLDTPGIGDVKGIEKDGENFEKIFSCLADWGELHAILILLKPNQARLTESMTYCLGELFGRLNKNCAPNVIFCCTNTRSYQYTPGDTYETLGALLDEIRTKWDVEIPCHRQQVFSFDNESFRFLCASKQIEFDDKKTNNYNQSWMNSVSEMFRLFTRINNLTPCKTNDSLMVFNVRTAINTLLHPLEEDQKKIRALEMVIDENEVKKVRLNSEQMDLLPKKHFNRINSVRRPRQNNRIDMVCTHCGEFDKHNPTEKHFKICHQDCKCSETTAARLNTTSEVLVQKCQCFDQETFVCKECRCPYQAHMKTEKELVQETVRELDKSVDQQIKTNVKELKAVERIVDEKMKEKTDLESHVRFLENGINQLGAHLKNSCLLPYNEYVDGYAKKEIEDLRRQGSDDNAGRDKKVAKLQKLQAEYEHLVRIVDQIGTDMPEETFESTISRIRQGASRSHRDRLTNIASFSARSDPFNRTTAVDIGKGWMGKLRADLY